MRTPRFFLRILVPLVLVSGVFTGCESTDGGGGNASMHGSMYYGVGFYDPWYHGGYYYPPDVIVTPPPPGQRPPGPGAPRPEQPIAKPPPVSASPKMSPSIPSTPRPMSMPRAGGMRR